MATLLERVIAEIPKLPERKQEAIAAWILEELASDREWEQAFTESAEGLLSLAEEALEEYRSGEAEELDPDSM